MANMHHHLGGFFSLASPFQDLVGPHRIQTSTKGLSVYIEFYTLLGTITACFHPVLDARPLGPLPKPGSLGPTSQVSNRAHPKMFQGRNETLLAVKLSMYANTALEVSNSIKNWGHRAPQHRTKLSQVAKRLGSSRLARPPNHEYLDASCIIKSSAFFFQNKILGLLLFLYNRH